MAKLSEKYEAIIVFSLKKTEDEIKALTAKFADLYNFESKPDFPMELERVINITDGVLRSIVVLAQGQQQ